MDWTDEAVSELTRLWKDGYSASEIAREMSTGSRNAVIGKVFRLGLPGRVPVIRKQRHNAGKTKNKRKFHTNAGKVRSRFLAIPSKPLPTKAQSAQKPSPFVSMMDLAEHHCRWPVGDKPGLYEPYFCGCTKATGLPYCEGHAKIAYRPADPSRRPQSMFVDRRHLREFA